MVYVFVRIVFVVQGQTVFGGRRKDENSTPILFFLAVSMLLLPLFPQCRAHHLAASVWGDAEARFSKIQHDKFEKKIFFLKQLSQHWKQPEDLRPLTFNLAGIKQEPAHLLFMTSSVGSVSLPFLLRIHSTAPTVVRVTSYTLFFFLCRVTPAMKKG